MKQEDTFKSFIEVNREAFEEDFDHVRLWNNIQIQSKKKNKIVSLNWVMKAAAIGLLLVSAFTIGRMTLNDQQEVSSHDENLEYNEMNTFYAKQVNLLISTAKNENVEEEVFNDVHELDIQMNDLMSEYELANNDEEELLLLAIINNYQTRIDLLNHVLIKINNQNDENTLRNEEIKI